ncbi:BAR/IMD domain-containing adapter protein 2-like [Dysidea avara]|uniref:BAR/IMD domain-containing adapter protein 2-like n=1 Tax=Dysidea avara TaxID=196820 RepID=UPI00331EC9B4
MDASMETSEQIHRLANTTFRNIEDILPELKNVIALGKSYQKALQNASLAASQFYHLVGAIGVRISSLPGAVRQLGKSFYQISVARREVAPTENSWVDSLMTDFLGPLEMKISKEAKSYASQHKMYKHNNAQQQQEVEKQESSLKSYKKKEKKKGAKQAPSVQESKLQQSHTESLRKLHNIRKEGLKKALLEERKLYCFTLDHFCNVFHAESTFYAKCHEAITKRIPDWLASCSEPNELPDESAILLEDPLSPKALRSPNKHSGTDEQDTGNPGSSSAKQQRRVFVFSASQIGVPTASSNSNSTNVVVPKSTTQSNEFKPQPAHQPQTTTENVLSSIPGVNPTPGANPIQSSVQNQTHTSRTRRPSCRVRGLYEYAPQTGGQLEIHSGDVIDAINDPKDGWQYGENHNTGQKGWFPCQYVEQVWPAPENHRKSAKPSQPQIPTPDYD